MPVLFCWSHLGLCRCVCMDGLYIRCKFQLNIGWETDKLLGVKISDTPCQLLTAYLSLTWPSPIGMKLVPDEMSGPRTHWGQVPKDSYRPIFALWPLKDDICQCLTPYNFLTRGPNFQTICVLCTMELGQCLAPVSARSVKVSFCVFWSLCSECLILWPLITRLFFHPIELKFATFVVPINANTPTESEMWAIE